MIKRLWGYAGKAIFWLVCAALAALAVIICFFEVVWNETSSINRNGFLVSKWITTPWRGAYVAFDIPPELDEMCPFCKVMVKRVIGLPGDAISYFPTAIEVGGQRFELSAKAQELGLSAARIGAVVPAGHVLAFGDTAGSIDSRYSIVGAIPLKNAALGFSAPLPSKKSLLGIAEFFGTLPVRGDAL